MSYINEAFTRIVKNSEEASPAYVSLYVRVPYYGGPEEGGWWGNDVRLVRYARVSTDEQAHALAEQVNAEAERLSQVARDEYGRHCLDTMEFLDARGLDADFLAEPDGPDEFFVVVEESPGSCESQGCRHYE